MRFRRCHSSNGEYGEYVVVRPHSGRDANATCATSPRRHTRRPSERARASAAVRLWQSSLA